MPGIVVVIGEHNGEQTNKVVTLILVGKDRINRQINMIISENNTFPEENEIGRL